MSVAKNKNEIGKRTSLSLPGDSKYNRKGGENFFDGEPTLSKKVKQQK
jgi:hypothetical protein